MKDKVDEIGNEGWKALDKVYCFCYIPEGKDGVRVIVKGVVVGNRLCFSGLSKNFGEHSSDAPQRPQRETRREVC